MPINSSNLPTTHQFKKENFPDSPEYFGQFLNQLNLFVDPIYQILNGGISYQNLIAPKMYTKTITTPSSGSVTFNFSNPLKIVPSAVLLGNVYVNGLPSSHPSSPAVVYWHFSEGNIYIDNITNLTTSTTYAVTLVVL